MTVPHTCMRMPASLTDTLEKASPTKKSSSLSKLCTHCNDFAETSVSAQSLNCRRYFTHLEPCTLHACAGSSEEIPTLQRLT